jgi:hypothetical protein
MKIDRIDKIAPLLSVAKEWSAVHPDNTQLPIDLPGDYRFGKAPTEVMINIPYASAWVNNVGLAQSYSLELVPLFGLPWSILSLSIRPSTLSPLEDIVSSISIVYILFDTLRKNNANALALQAIDRITLQFFSSPTAQLRDDTSARFLRSIVHLIKSDLDKMRLCKGVWMQEDEMECVGHRWTVGFNFVEGLDARGQTNSRTGCVNRDQRYSRAGYMGLPWN